jgi:glycosyltransferase involved in cell wall biosynthesis
LNVLLFYASEITNLGGAELSVLGLAEGLTNAGHRTTILEFAGSQSKRRLASGITILSLPRAFYPHPGRPLSWFRFSRSAWQFYRVVAQLKPDVISVHFPTWQSPPVVTAHSLPHQWRLVVTARGSDVRIMPLTQPRLSRWQSRLFRRADAVTAVSESLRQDVLARYPFLNGMVRVIHNAPARNFFEEPTDGTPRASRERYLLFVGALRSIKGVDILLRAWQRIQPQVPATSLMLVGQGIDLDRLVVLSETLGVSGSVRFVGTRSQDELPSLYRYAQVVVIPSRSEGLPRVALEAGACGAICVASRVGGLPEVLEDRVTGLLVDPESPEALAEGLLCALNLPAELKQRMSVAAKEKIRRQFDQPTMVRSYERLFQSLLQ